MEPINPHKEPTSSDQHIWSVGTGITETGTYKETEIDQYQWKETETETGQYQWNDTPMKTKIIRKTTKTIKKYDEKGKFLSKKVIIKEIEINEVPIWNSSINRELAQDHTN